MAGFLSEYDEVTTVYLDESHRWWAKVRRYLRRGDFKAAQAVLISPTMRMNDEQSETRGDINTGGYQNELVARALVEWNLTDASGSTIPLGTVDPTHGPDEVRYAAVNLLPESVFETLLGAIDGQGKKKAEDKTGASDPFRPVGEGSPVLVEGDEPAD